MDKEVSMRYYLIVLIMITVSSCSPRLTSAPPSTEITRPTNQASISATPDSQSDKMTSLAIADLSARLSLDHKEVRVVSVEPAKWADAALGCPRPGEIYAEQVELGYLIVLEANGQEYTYHTDRTAQIILCSEVKPNEPGLR
jgi:hypothetical protein